MPYSFRRVSLQRAARIVDLALVVLAMLLAMIVVTESVTWPSIENLLVVRVKLLNVFLLAGYLGVCSLIFSSHGFYRYRRARRWQRRLGAILSAVALIATVLLAARDLLDFSFATDLFLLTFGLVCSCMLVAVHELSRMLQHVARLHGKDVRNVVIVGDIQRGAGLAARIEQQSNPGYRVLRIISPKEPEV